MIVKIWTDERKKLALDCCEKWKGTPHKNRISVLGIGIDCVQFLNEIMTDAGIVERQSFSGYNIQEGMYGASEILETAIETSLNVEEIHSPEFGAIVVCQTGRTSGHCGFLDGDGIWHSLANQRVMRSKFYLWQGKVKKMYRFTELGWKGNPQVFVKKL